MPTSVFYYTKASFTALVSKIVFTAVTTILSFGTPLIASDGSNGGTLSLYEYIRLINNSKEKIVDAEYSMVTPEGSLRFCLILPDTVFKVGDKYQTYAIYRDGIYASSQFPTIDVEVLSDPQATRKITITY